MDKVKVERTCGSCTRSQECRRKKDKVCIYYHSIQQKMREINFQPEEWKLFQMEWNFITGKIRRLMGYESGMKSTQ